MTGDFQAAVNSGEFELLTTEVARPTEEFPHDCDGLANYDSLDAFIGDIV
jgi:hypothetical protein